MKTFEAEKGIGMSERESRSFLAKSRSTLLLGTTNSDGSSVIHPVWYYFDPSRTRIYFYTEPALKKAANVRERNLIYFDVDSDRWPYKGVKGKGRAKILTNKRDIIRYGKKILSKYIRKGHPWIKSALTKMKSGGYVVIEITPSYFTSWDYGKAGQPDAVYS